MAVDAVLLIDPLTRVKIRLWLFEPLTGGVFDPHREARHNKDHDDGGATIHR